MVRPLLQVLRLCLWEVRDEGKWSQIRVVTAFSLSQGSSWVALSQMGDGLTEEKANRMITASGFPWLGAQPTSSLRQVYRMGEPHGSMAVDGSRCLGYWLGWGHFQHLLCLRKSGFSKGTQAHRGGRVRWLWFPAATVTLLHCPTDSLHATGHLGLVRLARCTL